MQINQSLSEDVCPYGAIHDNAPERKICGHCVSRDCTAMHSSGLKWSAREISIQEILDEIHRSTMMFFDGGGVTFTGGEVSLQFEALEELLRLLKKDNIHIAVETNGTHPRLPELFPFIDWLIIDFKHYDADQHHNVLGTSNKTVLDNIRCAAHTRNQLLIRIPLINNFNASVDDAEHFAEMISSWISDSIKVELLCYHEYGKDKWHQCGLSYAMHDGFVTEEQFRAFGDVLKSHHISLVHT